MGRNHRSAGSVPAGETHPQMPNPNRTANPEQQRPTAPANRSNIREPLQASFTKAASPTQVKLEHSPSQSSLFDLSDIPRAAGRQSPPAAPLPHEGNLLTQASAAEPDHHELIKADLSVRAEASAPMTELQQVLSLFGADAAVGLAAKESALTQLVMLVADSMYVPVIQPVI